VALSFALVIHFKTLFWVDWEAPDDFHPDATDSVQDYEKNAFLDLGKPLLRQVWEANFRCVASVRLLTSATHIPLHSKSYYLQQVHQPRHLKESARLFGPDVLEVCWNIPTLFLFFLFLKLMFNRCAHERSGMLCLYFGLLLLCICSCGLSSNLLDPYPTLWIILHCQWHIYPSYPRTLSRRLWHVSSSEISSGPFWNIRCIGSYST
jgi:hypothetical protein